jgi:transcriptional regulator with XRE-family HTH domain
MPTRKLPHIEDYQALGVGLRALRDTVGITQAEAGERIGVRAQSISELERAERGPSWHVLLALLRAYGASLTDLDRAMR